jgi:hypothetical protein
MLLLVLVVLGVVVWAITTYIPMTPGIARLIQIVAVIIALVYVLNAFGVLHALSGKPVPSLR